MPRSSWATSIGYVRRLDECQSEVRVIGSPQPDGMLGGVDQPGEWLNLALIHIKGRIAQLAVE
jgi:hypothetical protein